MTEWSFETAYHYANGDVYAVTLQHIVTDGVCVETVEIRRVKLT